MNSKGGELEMVIFYKFTTRFINHLIKHSRNPVCCKGGGGRGGAETFQTLITFYSMLLKFKNIFFLNT